LPGQWLKQRCRSNAAVVFRSQAYRQGALRAASLEKNIRRAIPLKETTMNQLSRKSLIGTFALVASLSAPLAFAQSAETSAQQAAPPTETQQPATPTESPAPATAPAESAAGAPAKKSWADVDGDKDGKLSKTEAATVPALGQVFDQADADADGSLTADEYKAYVAKVQGGQGNEGTK